SFFHLRSLSLVLPYPSTFAAALALFCLAVFRLLVDSERLAYLPLGAPMVALMLVCHPVNSVFLVLGLLAGSLVATRPVRAWSLLIPTLVLGFALALAWPLIPVGELWLGQSEQVHEGNLAMYDDPLPRVAPALLGVPWLFVRLRRNPRDPIAWLTFALAG